LLVYEFLNVKPADRVHGIRCVLVAACLLRFSVVFVEKLLFFSLHSGTTFSVPKLEIG
jgi:hypothetical protein